MKPRKLNKIFAIILTFALVLSFLPQVYVPTALAAATNLPSGWTDVAMNDDISSGNAMVKSTSADYDSATQTFTIAGSEGKLQSAGDSAYFVNTTISGDFVATVRVASFAPFGTPKTSTTPQAILMLKNGTTKTSNGFFAVFNNANVLAYKRYTSTGTANASPAIVDTAPFYLRLEKVGNQYNTYYSKDGSSFGKAYATITDSSYVIDNANNNATLNIGLAVTEANATFDHLMIQRPDGTVLFGWDPATPPNAPTDLTVVNPGSDATVQLSWTAASGAASYTIRRGTQAGVYTDLATIPSSSTTYADTTAENGTEYFYVVTAKNSAGLESVSTSNEVSDTPVLPKPSAPTGLTAKAGDTQVILNWDAVAGAQSYTVKYATASEGPYTSVTGIASNSYTLTGLTNNTTYYFTVSAVNDAGPSQDAAVVQATPETLPPPQAPTGVTATGADAKVNVSWSAVNGANSYKVKRSTDGQNFTTVASGVTETNYTDTGLTNGTTYYYVVTAVNPQGESGNSAVVSAVPAQPVAGSPVISKSGGWFETAYVEWAPVTNSEGYNVYVKKAGASDSQYVQLDNQLIRQYPAYWRADAVGLPAGDYVMKVEALQPDGSSTAAVSDVLSVTKHDRSGFAFSSQSPFKTGSGAYNDDGSLRSGAQVIYVTSETAQTVNLDVITNSKGTKTTGTGIGDILKLRQKGYDKTPLDIRFIGQITKEDMKDQLNSSGYLEVKGNSAYTEMNMTLEGIGEDTYAYGWGFLVRNAGNVELRNIGMMRFPDDAFSMDTKNVNIWVHNNDLFYGDAGSDADQVKGDGSTDIKGSSTFITISYNHYWDSGKSSLSGLSEPSEYFVTFHHNWFDHSDSRHPRVRVGTIHVYNNYYDGVAKYGVGATTGSSIFVESNYWRNAHDPMMISLQGTDIRDGVANGTFSSESGGMIKAYNNVIDNPNSLIYANSDAGTAPANPTSFDAYLASSRNETVPSSYKALVGGTAYNNFDTMIETAVNPANIDDVNLIPQVVTAKAGRLNQGDFTWQFDNSVDDASYVVNTALKNKTLNYKTQLVAVGGNSTQQTTPAPGVPTDLTATAGDAQVTLAWTAVSGAASYNIKRSTTSGSGYTQVGTSESASYTDTSVTNGTTYYYVVEAANASGTSAASAQASATPTAANTGEPGEPGEPGSGITLVNDNFESAATLDDLGYSVTMPTPSAGTALDASIAAPSTALKGSTKSLYLHDTDKSASPQFVKVSKSFAPQDGVVTAEFDYMLTAAASASKVIRLLSSTGALAVDIQTAKNGSDTVFSYKTVPDGQSSAADNFMAGYAINTWYHFKIVADVSAQTADVYINGTKQITTLPFYTALVEDIGSIETLTPGSNTIDQYLDNILITAVGGTPEVPVPASPTGLTAAAGNGQVALAWTAVNDATGYNIKRSTTSGSGYTQVGTSETASYTDSGLTNGTTYYYVVEAVNSAGKSPASAEASATPAAPVQAPEAPTGLTAAAGNGQVALAWTAVNDATGYNIKRSTTSGSGYTQVGTSTAASYTDSGLTNGTTYYYVVEAVNSAGKSPASAEASATPTAPVQAPEAPTGLTAAAGNAQVALAWTAVNDVTGYNIKRSTVSGSGYTQVGTSETASYTDSGLTNGTTYYYVVEAVNSAGTSPVSVEASATPTAPAQAPEAPTGLTAAAGNGHVALAWTAVNGATGYNIKRSTTSGSGYTQVGTSTAASYTDSGLTNGTTYYYVVEAVNSAGTSPVSVEASATPTASVTITIPSVTASVYATGASSRVDITWATVTGATYYNVKRSMSASGPFTNIATQLTANSYADTNVTNGTTYYYVVTAANEAGESEASMVASAMPINSTNRKRSGGGSSVGATSSSTVTLNNEGSVSISTTAESQKTTDGKTAAVVTLDSATLDQAINTSTSNNHKEVVVEVKGDGTVAQVILPASSLLNASKQSSDMVLVVKFNNATYSLPMNLLNIDSLAKSIGADVKDAKVSIVIEQVSGSLATQIENAVKQAGAQLLTPAVDFTVTVEANGKSASVNDFGSTYVSRTLELSGMVDSKQATAVMIDPATGEMTFVPATFQAADGKTKVTISRPGNSIYSVVQFSKSFADIKDHWAKDDVELLASKLLVKGRTETAFDPQSSISRAEFAALLVRGLGLGEDKSNKFKDVSANDWYMGIVGAAAKAGLIEGDESGKFNPNASITREEMAVMINRAMAFAGDKTSGDANRLNAFKDAGAISAWAKDAVAKGVTAGLLNGKSTNTFEPSATANRAEAAVLLKRLLQTERFIN